MSDFTVFEKVFEKTETTDGLFIRLTCSEDNELQYVRVESITMNESLGLLIPTMIIDFVDGTGDFVNHNRLNTEAVYTLYFGRSMEDASETNFKIFNIQHGGGTQGRSNNMTFKVIFSHESWDGSISEKKSRGWNNIKFSEVVEEVVAEKGYDSVDVEESLRTMEQVLQINETDNQLIYSIQSKAKPNSEDGHYEFCGRLDNKFFFKSTYELIEDGMEKYKSKDMVLLRLGGQPPQSMKERAYKENENVPVSFMGFGANESYSTTISEGASGIESSYYDWENRAYIKKGRSFSDINSTQLSEWSLIREGVEKISKKIFGGRDFSVVDKAINTLSKLSLSMQDVTINLEGQTEIHCGDIVEVIIPTTEDSETPYNEMYSGFYMVKDVQHLMTLKAATDFVSKLTLTRNGMDAKNMKGYVKSKKGKVNTE